MVASTEPAIYEIRIGGYLDRQRASQLGELTLTHLPGGETLLSGPVVDQAALFGLLSRIRDMGIALIALQRLDPPSESAPPT